MVNLISTKDIQESLEEIGLHSVNDKDVLNEFKRLCLEYDIDAHDLATKWLSYSSQNRKINKIAPKLIQIEIFADNVLKKERAGKIQQQKLEEAGGDVPSLDEAGGDVPSALKAKIKIEKVEEEPTVNDEEQIDDAKPVEETVVQVKVEIEDGPLQEEPMETDEPQVHLVKTEPVSNEDGYDSADEFDDDELQITSQEDQSSSHCIAHFGEVLESDNWAQPGATQKTIVGYHDEDSALKQPFKSCQIRIHELKKILNDVLFDMTEYLAQTASLPSAFEDLGVESASEDYFIGRVVKHSAKSKPTLTNLVLEGISEKRPQIKLDLSSTSDFSVFSGQILPVIGVNEGDRGLRVSSIVPIPLLPFSDKKVLVTDRLSVIAVAGPFDKYGETENWDALLLYIQEHKPTVAIIAGPFIDEKDPNILDIDTDEKFGKLLNGLNSVAKLSKTEIIVIPSNRDFHHSEIVPTPPFKPPANKKLDYITFMSNPATINIQGCVFAVTSIDTLLHVRKEEIEREASGGRMHRICRHLLAQQSFYPLFAPSKDVNIDYNQYDYLRLQITPHFLILPSNLKGFCNAIDGCIAINPERLVKGNLARIMINAPPEGYTGSLENYCNVKVFKLPK